MKVLLRYGDFMKLVFKLFQFSSLLLCQSCYREEVHNIDTITAKRSLTSGLLLRQKSTMKIRSRAAVTGDVMAADVSPPPAGAALPVRLQVRPQDVDRGDG